MEKRFNSFEIVRNLREKELRKFFTPVDVVFKPVSKTQQTIDCYLADSIGDVYRGAISKGKRGVKYPTAEQCYGSSKFFIQKKSFKNHIKTCRSMPGIVYISTFEDNYRFMGDLPFTIYFDFEVAFHPDICIEIIFIQRSFAHMFEQLNSVAYLAAEMLPYFDPITAKQLRNCVKDVFKKREKFSVSGMFS